MCVLCPSISTQFKQKFSWETTKGINVPTLRYTQKMPALHFKRDIEEFKKLLLYPANSLWTDISWTTVFWA